MISYYYRNFFYKMNVMKHSIILPHFITTHNFVNIYNVNSVDFFQKSIKEESSLIKIGNLNSL